MDLQAISNNTQFVNPNLTIVNGCIVLYFGQFNKFCYYLVLIELEAIREYPVMLMAAIDPDNNVAHLHTCLSQKFYCIFADNAHTTVINAPSSEEDEEEADLEVVHANCNSQSMHLNTPPHALVQNSSMLRDPPTSPFINPNPLQ